MLHARFAAWKICRKKYAGYVKMFEASNRSDAMVVRWQAIGRSRYVSGKISHRREYLKSFVKNGAERRAMGFNESNQLEQIARYFRCRMRLWWSVPPSFKHDGGVFLNRFIAGRTEKLQSNIIWRTSKEGDLHKRTAFWNRKNLLKLLQRFYVSLFLLFFF